MLLHKNIAGLPQRPRALRYKMIPGALLAALALGLAPSCSVSRDDYRPKAVAEAPQLPKNSAIDALDFPQRDVRINAKTMLEVLHNALYGQADAYGIFKEPSGARFLVELDGALYVQDPTQNNKITSEAMAYYLQILMDSQYLGVDAQKQFDQIYLGVRRMTALGRGKFMSWVAEINAENNQLQLYENDAEGVTKDNAQNSASDADIIQALVVGRAYLKVENGDWQKIDGKNPYAEEWLRLEKALDNLFPADFTVGGLSVLQPSASYRADEEQKNIHLDYYMPAVYLEFADLCRKINPGRAAVWEQRAQDAWDTLMACLADPALQGRIPATGWPTEENGRLKILPAEQQDLMGAVRIFSHVAQALRDGRVAVTDAQRDLLRGYLAVWEDSGVEQYFSAALALPLAVELKETAVVQRMLNIIASQIQEYAVYPGRDVYYQNTLIIKTWLEFFFRGTGATVPQTRQQAAWRAYDLKITPTFTAGNFYGLANDGFGFIATNVPTTDNPDIYKVWQSLRPGEYLITSEQMAYGLLGAIANKDWPRARSLLKTIYWLIMLNYKEMQVAKLMPWAFICDGQNFRIVKINGTANFGNDSALDADQLLLAGMMLAEGQSELKLNIPDILPVAVVDAVSNLVSSNELDGFISIYAADFAARSAALYMDRDGKPFLFFKTDDLSNPIIDLKSKDAQDADGRFLGRYGSEIRPFNVSYPVKWVLETSAAYFQPGTVDNSRGSPVYYSFFRKLAADSQMLLAEVDRLVQTGKFFKLVDGQKIFYWPERVFFRFFTNGGWEIITDADLDAPGNEDFAPTESPTAARRLSMNGFIKYEQGDAEISNGSDDNYFEYYLKVLKAFLTANPQLKDRGRYKIEDTLVNSNFFAQLGDHISKVLRFIKSPLNDERWQAWNSPPAEPDQGKQPEGWQTRYRYNPNNIYTLETFVGDGRELGASKYTAPTAAQVQRDTLLRLSGIDDAVLPDTRVAADHNIFYELDGKRNFTDYTASGAAIYDLSKSWPLAKGLARAPVVDAVDTHITTLDVMLGHDAARLIQEINLLLAAAEWQKLPDDNAVPKALYIQKLLLWWRLTPLERIQLKIQAEKYKQNGDATLYTLYQAYAQPPVTQDDVTTVQAITYVGHNISNALSSQELYNLDIPARIKDLYAGEIVKKNVNDILQDAKPEDLQTALIDYVASLPQDYKGLIFVPIVFREDDAVSDALKEYFILDFLRRPQYYDNQRDPLDQSPEAKQKIADKYAETYRMLLSADMLVKYHASNDWLLHFKRNPQAVSDSDVQDFNTALSALFQEMNLIVPVSVSGAPVSDSVLAQEFAAKRGDVFANRYADSFMNALYDVVNELFWLGDGLEILLDSNDYPAELKEYEHLYRQLKPAAMQLIAWYKNYNKDGWQNNIKLRVLFTSLELRLMGGTQESHQQIIEGLHNLQELADAYGEGDAYAQCRLTEAYLCAKYKIWYYDEATTALYRGDYLYEQIQKDEKATKYPYINESLNELKLEIEARYLKNETPASSGLMQESGAPPVPDQPQEDFGRGI